MPFDTTTVIPPTWSEHHRPVTEGAMSATIRLENPGESGWDPVNGSTPGTPTVLWSGLARVQQNDTQSGQADAVDQDVALTTYLVVIPKDAPQPTADVTSVVITGNAENGDPDLVGKRFTVRSVETGSLTWERDLTCELDQTNQEAS
ncbi:DUF6093 family protein [Luteimicrobium sp. NPDC057192]|uniref:DUF6093 family protein n=1 Tax=Luteimicrobium sp. NPDC057192 TaxID=3346042 RepID=UPI0036456935